ncbi:hypothetical protein SRABI130_04101 [Pseudomonas sp. Bi130]|nr:hypothetical protein SRABI130_04101 [Pseudomonas sp. Bi130]
MLTIGRFLPVTTDRLESKASYSGRPDSAKSDCFVNNNDSHNMHLVGNQKGEIKELSIQQIPLMQITQIYTSPYTKKYTCAFINTNQVLNLTFESPSGTKIKKGLALQGLFFRL